MFDDNPEYQEREKQDLLTLLSQPDEKQLRPCPSCDIACPCSGSASCACACISTCQYAPQKMSSEPDKYPIEENITQLVYALNVMRVCKPCWSCEGHIGTQSEHAHRLPQVWFYSPSVLYPRLVAETLEQLRFQKKIHHEWCVRILGWGDTSNTRFAIIPVQSEANETELPFLQEESKIIAKNLNPEIRTKAKQYLKTLLSA